MISTNYQNIEIITNQLIIVVSWIVIGLVFFGIFWYCIKDEDEKKDTEITFLEVTKNGSIMMLLLIPMILVLLNICRETFVLILHLFKTSFMYIGQ